jgi:transposase-like protein
MTDDICGAETAAGTPCELPASRDDERCHLHTTDDDVNAPGVSSTFTEDAGETAIEAARTGKSQAGAARAAGVSESTLRGWLDRHPEFARAFTRARAQGETRLFEAAIGADEELDPQGARFILSTSFDYTERQEIEHSGEVDVEVEADFSDTST